MRGTFSFPTTIACGAGRVRELADHLRELNVRRPLVVTDQGLARTATFERALAGAPAGCQVFSDVRSNPTDEEARAATEALLSHGCDGVVAVGGGSAIDVGKIIRLRAAMPEWDFRDPVPVDVAPLAPLIAIPTTAGTGSEVGRSSVITIGAKKHVIFHPSLLAARVILDAELTVDLPPALTAATGADALTHCIESFTSPVFHPLCDALALEGIRLIAVALPRAVKEPRDLEARTTMLVAATMGGIAFQKDLGAAHSLAHPLSSICGLHHGLANALVLPAVMRFNAARKPGTYARVAQAIGAGASDQEAIAAVVALLLDVGISPGLAAQGVRAEQLDVLADQAFADGCHQTNPVPVTRQELYLLYREAT